MNFLCASGQNISGDCYSLYSQAVLIRYLCVQGFLLRDRGSDVETLDKLMKTKNIPEAHQDAFKTGFAEGFLKAQALTQKTNGKLI